MEALPPLDLAHVSARLGAVVPIGDLAVESETATASRIHAVVGDGMRRWIVRRPRDARALATLAAEDALLAQLGESSVPVPAVTLPVQPSAADPFDVITFIEGHRLRDRLPATLPRTSSVRHDLSVAMIDALIRLHGIDVAGAGLDLASAPPVAERLARWERAWEATGLNIPTVDELRSRLHASMPPPIPMGLLHGTFHINRLIFDSGDSERVAAVIGWEKFGLGDPQFDLGLLLALWAEDADEPVTSWLPWTSLTCDDGFFSRATVTHEYMQRSRHDLRHFEWFVGVGYLRLAIWAADTASPESLAAIEPMAAQALARADHSGIAGLTGGRS